MFFFLQLQNATIGFPLPGADDIDHSGNLGTLPPPPPPPSTIKAPAIAMKISSTAKVISLSGSGKKKPPFVVQHDPEHNKSPLSVVLENVTFDVEQKSKIALVGKNGSGKSTLLKLIASYRGSSEEHARGSQGEVLPLLQSGELYKHHNIRVAYYQQHQTDSLPYDLCPLEHFTNIAPEGHSEQTLRAHLGSFGLCGDLALEKIGVLSGGQRARVVLAQLTLFRPHLLLLDEPTNNIDLEGIQAMKEAVAGFEGACVIASHDMSFLEHTVDVVYHVSKQQVCRLENGVEEYKQVVRSNVSKQRKLT